jgi:succinate dehydrogenase / fumarate reductase iron-sulfur subunit
MYEPTRQTVRFRIERPQRPEGWEEFDVPVQHHTTVVDAIEWIKSHLDNTLMFRHSCHHGSCGTCGMIINNVRRLACTTRVLDLDVAAGPVEVRPLQTMRHLGDLAVDPTPLFKDFPVAASYLRPSEANRNSETPTEIGSYVRFENCIECGLCVSACPVIPLRGFMGPAGLAAYNRELDKHPERSAELLPQVDTPEGAWGCDRHLACSAVCPTGVYPAKHIVMLQKKIEKARPAAKD